MDEASHRWQSDPPDAAAALLRLSLAGARVALHAGPRAGWLTVVVERPGGAARASGQGSPGVIHDAWLEGRRVLWGCLPAGARSAEAVLGAGYELPCMTAEGAWLSVAPWRISSAVGPRGGRVTFRDADRRVLRVEPVARLSEPLPSLLESLG